MNGAIPASRIGANRIGASAIPQDQTHSAVTPPPAATLPPPLATALWRGARGRCPVCGEGKLFAGYLTLSDGCDSCGARLGHVRADDAPPYFVIFLVGHLLVPPVFWVERAYEPPLWLHMAVWLPLFTLACVLLLRPVKGATAAWMLRMGMGEPNPLGARTVAENDQAVAEAAPGNSPDTQRLARLVLPEGITPPSAYAEADRTQAVADLLVENSFDPPGLKPGPYALVLDLREGRLLLDIRDLEDRPLHGFALALGPFRRLIKDYLMIVASHEEAVQSGSQDARIQAIDMGRRGLHDEGAGLLIERLEGRVRLDFGTARRLFTLVCALHHRV